MNRELVHQIGSVTKVFFARLRFLSVFLIAGFIVGYWDNIKNHWDKWTRPPIAPDALVASAASDVEYYCVMHPNIIRSEPGNCPICGMPLVKRKKGQAVQLPEDVLARVQLSPQRIALAGIQTSPVEMRDLTREIHALGVLDYAEPKVAQLSARVGGRADRLFVQYVGQRVNQGDPLYSLYSPDVFSALKEYVIARQRVNELPKDATPDLRKDAAAVYNASLQKLVLWGVSRGQLEQIDHDYDQTGEVPTHLTVTTPIAGIVVRKEIFEGGYINVGDKPYTIADLDTLWLQVKLYERDVPLVRIGQAVEVTVDAMPEEVFHGVVTFKAFQLDPQTRTVDARVEVKNAKLRLRPGMFADASIRVPALMNAEAESIEPSAPPTTTPSAHPTSNQDAQIYAAALKPYLEIQSLLAQDKAENVPQLLHQMVEALKPLANEPKTAEAYKRVMAAHGGAAEDLDSLRKGFREVSAAMIDLGKAIGLPSEAQTVQVFHCPMAKADWLQTSSTTSNPFYGTAMPTCGAAVEALPKAQAIDAAAATQPAIEGSMVLAIPRSSVIEAGRNRIVYVQSFDGVFDMRAVKLGSLAGDYYPVLGGLQAGERVVTAGAFLIDSENRLNPTATASAADASASVSKEVAAPQHQH